MVETSKTNQAFTLVELSIVLLIIGLVVGAIYSGTALIAQAKTRALIKELTGYNVAFQTFQSIYNNSLPGDMSNATSYFGTTDKNGYTVYNGDGDGYIGNNYPAGANENVGVWQHLALAGLIQGTYTGLIYGSSPSGEIIGQNVPGSQYNSRASHGVISDTFWNQYTRLNALEFAGISMAWTFYDSVVNVVDAYNIDTKIDDGIPFSGMIMSIGNANNVCTATQIGSAVRPFSQYPYLISTFTLCTLFYAWPGSSFH